MCLSLLSSIHNLGFTELTWILQDLPQGLEFLGYTDRQTVGQTGPINCLVKLIKKRMWNFSSN